MNKPEPINLKTNVFDPDIKRVVMVDMTITEYANGMSVNNVVWKYAGDQDFVALMERLIAAVSPPLPGVEVEER